VEIGVSRPPKMLWPVVCPIWAGLHTGPTPGVVLGTNKFLCQGAPAAAPGEDAIILAPPTSPLDEGRIEQALNKLKEQLGKPETSGEDAAFDGEEFTEQQIKNFITAKGGEARQSMEEDDTKDVSTGDPLLAEEPTNTDRKTDASESRDEYSDHKEFQPFQSLPISYLKESVGDEDHEFFIEDPHRPNSFAEPAFRDVFDDADGDDQFSPNDDLIFR
ncbi:hypothetical protein BIW11_06586, partial [Tropilaelaps mercedesae]